MGVTGPQADITEAALTAGLTCTTTKYLAAYNSATLTNHVKQYAVGASDAPAYALLGARYRPGCTLPSSCTSCTSCFKVAAIGDYDSVFEETTSTSEAVLNKGTYWYFYPGKSMGFAPATTVNLNSADVYDMGSATRLSWYLDGGGGGYRAGTQSYPGSALDKVVMYCTI